VLGCERIRSEMNYDPNIEIPPEIAEAAIKIERYMSSQGHKKWKLMGIQSREDSFLPDKAVCSKCGNIVSLFSMSQ